MHIVNQLSSQLNQLRQQHRYRTLTQRQSSEVQFGSNDYLGLSSHPRVKAAYAEGIHQYGTSSGASPLVSGYQAPHAYLREQLAQWLEREDALLFSSGFAANQCAMHVLAPMYQRVVLDKLSHASLIDGVRHFDHWKRFHHNDVAHAKQLLLSKEANLLVTESVFSMDGDRAPLTELAQLQADLWIDDAHGIGVCGDDGRSVAGQLSAAQVPLLTITFGKGLGVMGAAIVGSSLIIDYLTNHAREFIYSTAMPAAQALAVSTAIDVVANTEGTTLRQRLNDNIGYFRECCRLHGLPIGDSHHAIQTLIVGEDAKAMAWGQALKTHGIQCGVIRPPTVPRGSSRLRMTIAATHSRAQIDHLVAALVASRDSLDRAEITS